MHDEFKITSALMVYSNPARKKFYVESHAVENGALLAGKPITRAGMKQMITAFHNEKKKATFSFAPVQLLAHMEDVICWYSLPRLQAMSFTEDLHIPDGLAWVPGVVYLAEGKNLSVFAMKAKKRPIETTPLFRAPFHNIHENGEVCMGNAKLFGIEPGATSKQLMAAWEAAFWNSRFSHLIGSSPVAKGENVNLIWKDLRENGTKKFPDGVLVPSKQFKTVGGLIDSRRRGM